MILKQLSVQELIYEYSAVTLTRQTLQNLALLLEAQYERQRMFTSCAWFFDDLDRIEPRNNIAYAAQAIWRVSQATGINLSMDASNWLARAVSQVTGAQGDQIFQQNLARSGSIGKPCRTVFHSLTGRNDASSFAARKRRSCPGGY